MTNLEKLNLLLENKSLKIPDHVREVHASGKNLKWLKKNLTNTDISKELKTLLNMTVHQLHQNYEPIN